jgi:hypothetical protein
LRTMAETSHGLKKLTTAVSTILPGTRDWCLRTHHLRRSMQNLRAFRRKHPVPLRP